MIIKLIVDAIETVALEKRSFTENCLDGSNITLNCPGTLDLDVCILLISRKYIYNELVHLFGFYNLIFIGKLVVKPSKHFWQDTTFYPLSIDYELLRQSR